MEEGSGRFGDISKEEGLGEEDCHGALDGNGGVVLVSILTDDVKKADDEC